jgi:CubicO group peptidase (beta-lactamase class C family)
MKIHWGSAIRTLHVVAGVISAGILCHSLTAQAADPLPRAKPEEVGMSSDRLGLIGRAINAEVAAGQLPGAVVGIARRGKLVYFEAFGYRDKVTGVPMMTDTIFSIASMTKPMVAVAALQLYEQGRLLMDDPLAKYFPKFRDTRVAVMDSTKESIVDKVPAARKITIQDLFRHTSGLIYGGRGATAVHKLFPESSAAASTSLTGPEFLDKLSALPVLHQPGTVWDYGFGLDVLGLVVESLTEKSLGQYLQEHVIKPLGMVDTAFVIPADKVSRFAQALPNDPLTGQPQSIKPTTRSAKFECGGGCLSSTASDYMRFALMLANKGTYDGNRILGRKTVEYMVSNQLAPDLKNMIGITGDPTRADYGFGLGVAVRTEPGIVRMMGSVGDFSWPGASGTNWWVDPREELTVVFMAHSPGPIRWKYRQMINALVYQSLTD